MGAVLVVFMVRPRGLEPPQDCSYQPLKLARLPFRHDRLSWLFNGISPKKLERVKRIELSQSAWKAEVLPLNYTRILGRLMGIEPTNVGATIRCVNHFATIAIWCRKQDLNPQPTDYKSVALPIELFRLFMVEDDGLEPPTLCL